MTGGDVESQHEDSLVGFWGVVAPLIPENPHEVAPNTISCLFVFLEQFQALLVRAVLGS